MKRVTSVRKGDRSEHDWGSITWLHSAEFSGSSELTVGEVVIRSGHANPAHSHPNCEEVLYVLEGEVEHSFGSEKPAHLVMGDAICIPRGILHNARCVSQQDARMVVSFSTAHRQVAGE